MKFYNMITAPKTVLYLALSLITITGLFGFATIASAQSSIAVSFQAQPLFLDADVKPGDSTTRTVEVENQGTDSESVFVSIQNEFDEGGLSSVMQLSIVADGVEYFVGNFADFFSTTPVPLGSLSGGGNRTYEFIASLPTSVGNQYQETQFGFDLIVGFVGGEQVSDTPPRGRGNNRGVATLQIRNEAVDVSGNSATITWTTNRPATSFVVCGLEDRAPFILTPNAPFGYDFVIPEVSNLVTSHSLREINLDPGQYRCRAASRETLSRPFTVGTELVFVVSEPEGLVAGEMTERSPSVVSTVVPVLGPTGSVLGISKKGLQGGPTYSEWRAELERERLEREEMVEMNEADKLPGATATSGRIGGVFDESDTSFLSRVFNNRIAAGVGAGFVLALLYLLYNRRRM